MYIERKITPHIVEQLKRYPIVSVTGPRQSGKTTLLKHILPEYRYVTLEDPEAHAFALEDPKGFLARYDQFVIFDEIQRAPQLFNYLQGKVDTDQIPGQYVLSGSQNFLLMKSITQSLAGRVALFKLLPFSFEEAQTLPTGLPALEHTILQGGFPRLLVNQLAPDFFFSNYLETYIQRDVRQLTAVQDLVVFRNFVKLCAGRIGQPLNYASLSSDAGVSPVTAKAWLNLLETSFILFTLPPWFENFNKRITKSAKLYFYDTGLAAYLLGARQPGDIESHFARGQLFENLIVAELKKQQMHKPVENELFFWQDSNKNEIDIVMPLQDTIYTAEMKAGQTINSGFLHHLLEFDQISAPKYQTKPHLVYGGAESYVRSAVKVTGWKDVVGLFP